MTSKSKIKILSREQQVSMGDEWFEINYHNHFWMKWRFEVLKQLLKPILTKESKILEIGCGNGQVMWQFEHYINVIVDGCDLNKHALNNIHDVSGDIYLYDIYDLDPKLTNKYDIVLLLDVLEHIDNDNSFIGICKEYLRPGGHIIIGVPAHMSLFSKYDTLVGHKRRYLTNEIDQILISNGLSPVYTRYWGFSLLPLVFIRKYYLKIIPDRKSIKIGFKPPNEMVNWFMKIVMKIETSIFPKRLLGTSVISMGKK